jgi:uncharacterized protein YwgA
MDPGNAILVVVQDTPKGRATRTALQKVLYFGHVKGLVKTAFEPHFYGPYSSEIASRLEDLTSVGLVKESVISWTEPRSGWESRKYEYSLSTDLGKMEGILPKGEQDQAVHLRQILATCYKITKLEPDRLSAAAKVFHILREKGKPLHDAEVRKEAHELGWRLTDAEVEEAAVGLLSALGLASRGSADRP